MEINQRCYRPKSIVFLVFMMVVSLLVPFCVNAQYKVGVVYTHSIQAPRNGVGVRLQPQIFSGHNQNFQADLRIELLYQRGPNDQPISTGDETLFAADEQAIRFSISPVVAVDASYVRLYIGLGAGVENFIRMIDYVDPRVHFEDETPQNRNITSGQLSGLIGISANLGENIRPFIEFERSRVAHSNEVSYAWNRVRKKITSLKGGITVMLP